MYRENITEFIKQEKAILYIPKNGGLNDYVINMLPEIGVDINTGIIRRNGIDAGQLEIIAARGSAIPQRIIDKLKVGQIAYGLTGDDLFDEFMLKSKERNKIASLSVLNTYDWYDPNAKYKRPALVLMNRSGSWDSFPEFSEIGIRESYKRTSLEYLTRVFSQKGIKFDYDDYPGGTEDPVTLLEASKDGCIEIVYSAKTADELGLKSVDVVRFSDISLIGFKAQNVWQQEYDRIIQKRNNKIDSYTSKLLDDKNEIVKKFGQESAEFIDAFVRDNNLAGEALDVIYAVMLGLAKKYVSWEAVEHELLKRWK